MAKRMTKREKIDAEVRNNQKNKMFLPIKEKLVEYSLVEWAKNELNDFKYMIENTLVDDLRSYSESFGHINKVWYGFLHERLGTYGFVNGEPTENTWEKRAKAKFWWEVYGKDPQYYFPCYDHHCSSKNRQEQMLNYLNNLLEILE